MQSSDVGIAPRLCESHVRLLSHRGPFHAIEQLRATYKDLPHWDTLESPWSFSQNLDALSPSCENVFQSPG